MGAVGAHGDSCETAGYFWSVWVVPAWEKFETLVEEKGEELTVEEVAENYPFGYFFADANNGEGIFTKALLESGNIEEVLEVARGGYRHIEKMFTELEDIRPFELLKGNRERQAYLLANEARVVAMTATHAGIKVCPIRNEAVGRICANKIPET